MTPAVGGQEESLSQAGVAGLGQALVLVGQPGWSTFGTIPVKERTPARLASPKSDRGKAKISLKPAVAVADAPVRGVNHRSQCSNPDTMNGQSPSGRN